MNKAGHFIWAKDGTTVVLDDNGILQTWQEGQVENVDASNPAELNVFLPTSTRQVLQALLRFRLKPFRSYSQAAASGGGGTSGPSSTTTTGPSSEETTVSGGGQSSGVAIVDINNDVNNMFGLTYWDNGTPGTNSAGSHDHDGETSYCLGPDLGALDHYHDYREMDSAGSHSHSLSNINHSHQLRQHNHNISSHTHGMDHTHGINHTHTIGSHTHPIQYGIYTSTAAAGVTVIINGVDRTAALGGPFNADQANLNLTPYMVAGQWNTIQIGSTQLGRIDATVFIQALMEVLMDS